MLRSRISQFESWLPEMREKLRIDSKKRFMLLLLFFNTMLVVILLLSVRNQEILRQIQVVQIEIKKYADQLATIEATVLKVVYITATPTMAAATGTPTVTLAVTATGTPTVIFTPTPLPSNTPTSTRIPPSPTPSATPTIPAVTPTLTPTWTPTPSPTPSPTPTPTWTPTPSPTPTPTWTPTPTPVTPTPIPRATTLILTASPVVITADGNSTSLIRVQVFDQNGKPVPDGTQVTFTTNRGTVNGAIIPVVVLTTEGTAQVTLTSSTSAGTATVTATAEDASGDISVRFMPRVRISKGVSRSTAPTGSVLTYTIVVRNASTGGEAASLRTLNDTLPAGFSYISGSTISVPASIFSSDPTVAGQSLSWTPSPAPYSLAPSSAIDVTFRVAAQAAPGTYSNIAVVGGDNFNSASTGETAQVTLLGPAPASIDIVQECNDVPVTITIDGSNFAPGATVTLGAWTLNVTWVDESTLAAIVPQDIAAGLYDLTVTNPGGTSGTLHGAYTALNCGSLDTTLDSGYLGTYGAEPGFSPRQGDDDQVQVLFLEVPEGTSEQLYIRVFDPDCGGNFDRQNGLVWDTPFTYTVYGGSGAFTPDVSSGTVLETVVFAENAGIDGNWYNFGPLAATDGDLVNGKRVFKLAVIGGPEPPFTASAGLADLNLYNVALSTSPATNTAPSGARIFAFSWTFLIPQATYDAPPRLFPYVGLGVSTFTQHNWDYDNSTGTAGITMTTPVRTIVVSEADVSGDGEERSSDYAPLEGEWNTTWAVSCWAQPVVVADNLVTFWATDQNGDLLAIFARSTVNPPP